MTNWEYYKDNEEFQKICSCGNFAVEKETGKIAICDSDIKCRDCKLSHGMSCGDKRLKWLDEEYTEPKEPEVDWSQVDTDTPILVRNNTYDNWGKRYFAKFENDRVYAWITGRTSWTAENIEDCNSWRFAKLAE